MYTYVCKYIDRAFSLPCHNLRSNRHIENAPSHVNAQIYHCAQEKHACNLKLHARHSLLSRFVWTPITPRTGSKAPVCRDCAPWPPPPILCLCYIYYKQHSLQADCGYLVLGSASHERLLLPSICEICVYTETARQGINISMTFEHCLLIMALVVLVIRVKYSDDFFCIRLPYRAPVYLLRRVV
jgi:hypothetical protein